MFNGIKDRMQWNVSFFFFLFPSVQERENKNEIFVICEYDGVLRDPHVLIDLKWCMRDFFFFRIENYVKFSAFETTNERKIFVNYKSFILTFRRYFCSFCWVRVLNVNVYDFFKIFRCKLQHPDPDTGDHPVLLSHRLILFMRACFVLLGCGPKLLLCDQDFVNGVIVTIAVHWICDAFGTCINFNCAYTMQMYCNLKIQIQMIRLFDDFRRFFVLFCVGIFMFAAKIQIESWNLRIVENAFKMRKWV